MFYYITLAVTLLIFIFRQSTTRTFFLSLLAALLLTIFTALVMSYSSNGDTAFFAWMIVYTIVFFLGSLTTWFMKKRNVFTGISINLFVYIVSILPLLLMAWYISWYEHQPHPDFVNQHFENKKAYFFYSEIASGVLLVILLATYISKVYRRWYALPEE
jgi:hypothetical protein